MNRPLLLALVMVRSAWLEHAKRHPWPVNPSNPSTFPRLTNAEIRLTNRFVFSDEEMRIVFEVCL